MGGLRKGFTLIELLIVVAIIAILAAIAVPNFLEAQTRAKVSRVKADLRTMATALEAYYVDNNTFPAGHRYGILISDPSVNNTPVLERLSTPVAYLSSVLVTDPFKVATRQDAASVVSMPADEKSPMGDGDLLFKYNSYSYCAFNSEGRSQTSTDGFVDDAHLNAKAQGWIFHSAGPDSNCYNLGGVLANDYSPGPTGFDAYPDALNLIYDPTNGTISYGSVWRASSNRPSPTMNVYAAGQALMKAIGSQK